MKRYTITAALPYTNGPIHIGHLSGVYIPADIYARYLRLCGKDVVFICGSDEHGVAISIKASKEATTPKSIIDKYDKIIRESFEKFGISFDNYSRTSRQIHYDTASEFFKKLNSNKKFIEMTSDQLFDKISNKFLADRFVTGTCPICSFKEAYGDQCEKCGSSLNAIDLINPKSTLSGKKPILKKTKHWYLPLDKYENFIKDWILDKHKNDWKANVYGQVKSWVDDGLKPRAVTRDLDWGIPVPTNEAEGKVLYVWFDAPIGYISSTKEWAFENNKNWEDYWKNEETELVHFIGKDNIVFHCIIFPSMLKAHGEYILPKNVPANEFLNLEGEKISTSKNWAVWIHEYLEDFPNKEDVMRYVLISNMPETKDSDFTWKDFQAKNNNELVAIYGNYVNRVIVLINKYYMGKIPTPEVYTKEDEEIINSVKLTRNKISLTLKKFRFRESSSEMINIARIGNKYLADNEPWKQIKNNPDRTKTILFISIQLVAALAYLSEPFLPFTSLKLKGILGIEKQIKWEEILNFNIIKSGHKINKESFLFEKIEDGEIYKQYQKLEKNKK
ncbi:MAG: methionine--tRNA ligase [Flavobacteriaceae bacterium]|nr:methionine--tRNA ligase [Flavobacteriaceae bacterium]|tara:strand:- start:886 stop:2565 length:1680 start_codon:yes stop_codon:yes gene_type:complete